MLVDIEDFDETDNTNIYFNDNANHNSESYPNSSRQFRGSEEHEEDHWGDSYPFKPLAQVSWDDKVRVAAVAAASVDVDYEVNPTLTKDLRPRVYDYNAQMYGR